MGCPFPLLGDDTDSLVANHHPPPRGGPEPGETTVGDDYLTDNSEQWTTTSGPSRVLTRLLLLGTKGVTESGIESRMVVQTEESSHRFGVLVENHPFVTRHRETRS